MATWDGEDVAGTDGAGEDAGADGADETGTELEATCDGAEVAGEDTGADGTDDAGTELEATCDGDEVAGTIGTTGVVAFLNGTTGTDDEMDPDGIGKIGVSDMPGAVPTGVVTG